MSCAAAPCAGETAASSAGAGADGRAAHAAATTIPPTHHAERRMKRGRRTMRPMPRQLDSSGPAPEHAPVLVLASASPRRQQLLAWLGVPYDVLPAEVDEAPLEIGRASCRE